MSWRDASACATAHDARLRWRRVDASPIRDVNSVSCVKRKERLSLGHLEGYSKKIEQSIAGCKCSNYVLI